MSSLNDTMDDTRRCLFPYPVLNDVSFETELLNSMEMIQATDPDSSVEADEEVENHKPSLQHSPIGVAELFPPALHSTIRIDEHGAEVTLGLEKISLHTPERTGDPEFLGRSLMDLCTPTPPQAKPNRHFVDGWCGNPSMNCVADDTYELPSNRSLEDIISSFLGDSEDSIRWNGCSVWQEWAFSVDSEPQEGNSGASTLESLRLTNLRQRALSLKTRQTRIHQMKRDLHPFDKSPARTPPVVRSQSFSVSDHQSAVVRATTQTCHGAASRHSGSWLCTLPENAISESPLLLRYNNVGNPKEVCYDSDPEDFARCRSPKRARHDSHVHSSVSVSSIGSASSVLDQHFVMQEFMNQTFTLISHPSARDDQAGQGPSCPVAMDAWLERGQILQDLIQPKWLFRPKSRRVYRKGSLVNDQALKSIELLDIARILELPVVDRTVYPLAKPFNAFIIRNINGDDFCFEAQSKEECNVIVFSLKLAIARFGAMVLTSNQQIYQEFFASTEHCVLGGAPQVVNMLCESTDSED